VAGVEGVRADLLDDLHRVAVVLRRGTGGPHAVAQPVGRVVARGREVAAAVELDLDTRDLAGRMRDLTRRHVRDRHPGLGQPVAVEPQQVGVGDEVQLALVADVVL